MKKEELYALHAEFCKTFTNPKRIEILDLLRDGEMTVTEIQNKIGIEKAHASLMLNFMRMKNILKTRRAGTNVFYSIADDKIAHACVAMQDALTEMIGKRPRARTVSEGR
jgi:ArsR family transcriptional regulator